MYNKLFTKILDSSIWLESNYTRIVWITLLATMDEDGFCQYASPGNVAQRAIVPLEEAVAALKILESPDLNSSDRDDEGRRIERVPGGWMVLNAKKYKKLATRESSKIQTRERVRKFRERNADVTVCNADVTARNDLVTTSETETETETKNLSPEASSGDEFVLSSGDKNKLSKPSKKKKEPDPRHMPFRKMVIRYYQFLTETKDEPWGAREAGQLGTLLKRYPTLKREEFIDWLKNYAQSENINPSDPPFAIIAHLEKYRVSPLNKFGKPPEEKPEERAWR